MAVRRHAKLHLTGAMFACAGVNDRHRQPVIARQEERALQILNVGGSDVGIEFAQVDVAVDPVAPAIVIRDLDEEQQSSICTAGFKVASIEFDFDTGLEALMEREFGAGDVQGPVEGICITLCVSIFDPLIEGNSIEGGVEDFVGRCRGERKGGEEDWEEADHFILLLY